MSRKNIPWLRGVYDSRDLPIYDEPIYNAPEQMWLPFAEPDLAIILDAEEFRHHTFRKALDQLKPKWIFDLRAAPRFDNLIGKRSFAFHYFSEIGSTYVDVSGSVSGIQLISSDVLGSVWSRLFESILKDSDYRSAGPYIALLDDSLMINSVSRCFASSISHATGRPIALSQLRAESIY